MLDILNKDDYRADTVHKNLVIELDDGTLIDNVNIKSESMKLREILMDGEQLKFGRCNSSQFSVTLADVAASIKGRELRPRIEIGDNALPLGVFTVKEVPRLSQTPYKQITALDNMHKIDRDVTEWYNNLSFPLTQKAFRDSFFAYIGLEQVETTLLFDDLVLDNPFGDIGQINGRTIAEGICELNAKFGHCDRQGRFNYVGLGFMSLYPADDIIPSDNIIPNMPYYDSEPNNNVEDINDLYIKATYSEYTTQFIDKIITIDDYGYQLSNNDYGVNPYVINNNFLLYGRDDTEIIDIMNKFMGVVSTLSYRPLNVDCKGLPYVELGDRVSLNIDGYNLITYVFNRTLTGIQALRDTYSAEGEEYLFNDLNSIQTKIENLNRSNDRLKIEVTRTSEGLKSKVSKGDVSSEISQESGIVSIKGNRFELVTDNIEITKDGKLRTPYIIADQGFKVKKTLVGDIDPIDVLTIDGSKADASSEGFTTLDVGLGYLTITKPVSCTLRTQYGDISMYIVPFVIDDYTDDAGWHIRKYSNGYAECEGQFTFTNQTSNGTQNGFNSFFVDLDLPNGLFKSTPQKIYNISLQSGFGIPSSAITNTDTKDSVRLFCFAPGSSTGVTLIASVRCSGKWK